MKEQPIDAGNEDAMRDELAARKQEAVEKEALLKKILQYLK